MKIEAELDSGEAETLFDILQTEIVKHKFESKCQFLCREIDKSRFEWHQAHAEFLEELYRKLLPKKD